MKEIIQHEKYGTIEFSEGNLVANRTITVNGQVLTKKSNKQFYLDDGTSVKVIGGLFSGVKLDIGGDIVQVSNPGTWYELAIYITGLVFLIVWSNSVALCSIIPMIGGAIGGILFAIPAVIGFSFSVKQKNPVLKLIITFSSVLLGLIICAIVGLLFISIPMPFSLSASIFRCLNNSSEFLF